MAGGVKVALKYLSLFPVAYLSLLGGATIVHNIYKPDLTIPDMPPPKHDHDEGQRSVAKGESKP